MIEGSGNQSCALPVMGCTWVRSHPFWSPDTCSALSLPFRGERMCPLASAYRRPLLCAQ